MVPSKQTSYLSAAFALASVVTCFLPDLGPLSYVRLLVIPCVQTGGSLLSGSSSCSVYVQISKHYARNCHLSFILCLYNLLAVAF